jgi:hypothetical protein
VKNIKILKYNNYPTVFYFQQYDVDSALEEPLKCLEIFQFSKLITFAAED